MYRVLLIDDEIWSVVGLKKIIQEDSKRFQLIYETTDSMDALDKIKELRPDAVITDIQMPEMSGIELMHSVRKLGLKTEFVVISGYAEFSYVQQAMQQGAIDYQLKPFNRTGANEMLNRLYHRLEDKRINDDMQLYIQLRADQTDVEQLMRKQFQGAFYEKTQIAILFYTGTEFPKLSLEKEQEVHSMFLKVGPRKGIFIVNSREETTELLMNYLKDIQNDIEKVAVSRVESNVHSWNDLLEETEDMVRDAFVHPQRKIFRHRIQRQDLIEHICKQFQEIQQSSNLRKMRQMLLQLPDVFIKENLGMAEAVYFWNRMISVFTQCKDSIQEAFQYLDADALSERFANFSEICSYMNEQIFFEENGTASEDFFELIHYINQHYAEQLLLKELCNQFYINMSYCCELFQKHKKMTFSQYLTEVRISKACNMLKNDTFSISEICDLVGYKDYFYFNKVFKKRMGCTPSEYRKNLTT